MGKTAPSHAHVRAGSESLLATFDEHAVAIARRQYFHPGDEDLGGMFRRVASWVASVEPEETREETTQRFFELMAGKRFCPGGRVLAGAATSHGNVLNCFVQDGSPEEVGTDAWVIRLATKLALVTKVGGGNGVCLDPIRAKRPFPRQAGRLYLTIAPSHPDYEKVRDGTFMDLVHGKYVTKGYRYGRFVEYDDIPAGLLTREVGDSVEQIWKSAGDMALGLLEGKDVLLDLSKLRAEGTPVHGSGGTSSGPSSFAVEVFDNFAVWASLGGAEYAGPVATLRHVFAPTLRAIRQGGCLHPDTLVNTSRGTLRLSELVDAHQYGWQSQQLKVATDQGWKNSDQCFNNGNAPTMIVTLANGQKVQGTKQHRLKVLRHDGSRGWVRLDELRQGDHVIQVLDQHTGAPVLLQPVPQPHHNARALETPEILNERLAFFLGYLWGDGFVSSGRVGLAVAHGSPMMEEAPRLFRELFGLHVRLEQKQDDASAIFVVKSSHLVAWLKANGLAKGEARELELPRAIRMAPRPVAGAFFRGLFEADGTLVHGYPALATASGKLAQDVAAMLAGLGIPTTQRGVKPRSDRYSRFGVHHVRVVSSKGLERFVERVGFMAGSRLEAARDVTSDEHRETQWALPHSRGLLAEAFDAMPASAEGRPSPYTITRRSLSRYVRGARTLTATGYEPLRRPPDLAGALPELSYDEYYVQVRSVEDGGRTLTLDISVEENKTYLANGLVSHNTRRGAGMATMSITHDDVHDFITAKDLDREEAEGDISTFNISVLVTDDFMHRSMQARAHGERGVLSEIADHAWQTGEPGLIFIDRINEHNPMQGSYGDIRSTNPCVTAETWVQTHIGPRQVGELVGVDFCATVEGVAYPLRSRGFWKTGRKQVYKLRTRRGHELRLTADHKLAKVLEQRQYRQDVDWTPLAELTAGDVIRLVDQREAASWSGPGTHDEGWLLGLLAAEGGFCSEADRGDRACLDLWGEDRQHAADRAVEILRRLTPLVRVGVSASEGKIRVTSETLGQLAHRFGVRGNDPSIEPVLERTSRAFHVGFLRGLFDADGSVQCSQEMGASVRLARCDLQVLQAVQRMLLRLGIAATVDREGRPEGVEPLPDGGGGTTDHEVKAQHELVVAKDNLAVYARSVGFTVAAKEARLVAALDAYERELDRERFVDEIVSIEPDGEEDVYDVTVDTVHAFDANGILAHNCGEIPLYPGEPCDLGAMNLAAYVAKPNEGLDGFDFAMFRADVASCTRFLDNVLEVNHFALQDNRRMSMKLRRLGLGVMGLADALIKMGYAYDTPDGRGAVESMIAALREAATDASEGLAVERGPFPEAHKSDVPDARRNVAVLTVAPTGTTSMLMGVSSGVEPVFAPFIYRKIGDAYAALIHPLFQELLDRHAPHPDFRDGDRWDWEKVVDAVQENHGSVQGLDFIPDDVKGVLICAHDIAPRDHVEMQGMVQRTFDGGKKVANSISKTINMPNEASVQDVYDAYSLAFETGCKGITVYRDGSRQFQVLSTKAEKKQEAKDRSAASSGVADGEVQAVAPAAGADRAAANGSPAPTPAASDGAANRDLGAPARPASARAARNRGARLPGEPLFDRPGRLEGFTDAVKLTLPTGEKRGFYVIVNKQDGLPSEVFILSGKAGDEANADSEALGRVVSIALQYGVPAEAIVKTLRGINGGMYGTYQGRMVASKADLLAVALESAGTENVLNQGRGCPDCGAPLRFEEGCQKCESCGYSKCG